MNEAIHTVESISEELGSNIRHDIDVNYNVVVYIDGLEIYINGGFLKPVSGRGLTYEKACKDYLKQLYEPGVKLRYDFGYATNRVRKIIESLYQVEDLK